MVVYELQLRLQRQAEDVVQIRFGNGDVVVRRDGVRLGVSQRNIRCEDVELGDGADIILSRDVVDVALHIRYRFMVYVAQFFICQQAEIALNGRKLCRLFYPQDFFLGAGLAQLSHGNLPFYAAARIERNIDAQAVTEGIGNAVPVIYARTAAVFAARRIEGVVELRHFAGLRFVDVVFGTLQVIMGDLNIAVIIQSHLHGLGQRQLDGLIRSYPADDDNRVLLFFSGALLRFLFRFRRDLAGQFFPQSRRHVDRTHFRDAYRRLRRRFSRCLGGVFRKGRRASQSRYHHGDDYLSVQILIHLGYPRQLSFYLLS